MIDLPTKIGETEVEPIWILCVRLQNSWNHAQTCLLLIPVIMIKGVKSQQAVWAEWTVLPSTSVINHSEACMKRHESAFTDTIKKRLLYNQYTIVSCMCNQLEDHIPNHFPQLALSVTRAFTLWTQIS